ncbi:MAG: flagellar hook-length control protein FliK [Rhodocyclales bacterium]|nr:flagellar hook-length control protein FliK [Rhodocyclales bacterium]
MVMIPTPVGVQVRSQTDAPLNPLRPVAEIPSDLPDFQPGQVFRARIQEVLPENTYKALVAGRSLTLALPESVKAGDTLELVVVGRTPGAVVAKTVTQLAESGRGTIAEPFQRSTLSNLGQLLASLLPREGEAAAPATFTRGQPLLSLAALKADDLAQSLPARLAQAISTSGLFYEAHQVQWALGQRSLTSLLAEPQGQYAQPATRAAFGGANETELSTEKSALAIRREAATNSPSLFALQKLFGGEASGSNASTGQATGLTSLTSALANPGATVVTIPDDLRPLVQQQLEAASTQRLAWHGDIWPGQEMQWEIERDARQGDAVADEPVGWRTSLRLTLPRLGEVEARVHLVGKNVHLVLDMPDAVVTDLQQAVPLLQKALAVAGLTLQPVQARRHADA